MAESKKNIVMHGVSGKLGDMIVFRQKDGKTYVANAPGPRTRPPSPAQVAVHNKFKAAAIYGKSVMADPSATAAYEATLKAGESVYNAAVADFFKPPVIVSTNLGLYRGLVDDTITVRATDDFKVDAVEVEIKKPDGSTVEKGFAVAAANGLDWVYTAKVDNPAVTGGTIIVRATDVPGNADAKQYLLH